MAQTQTARLRWLIATLAVVLCAPVSGCKTSDPKAEPPKSSSEASNQGDDSMAQLTVTSSAFAAGEAIPKKYAYTGEGDNVSPPLAWSGAPAGTKAFALICDDPDAPSPKNPRANPWVHWLLYDIPASTTALAEGSDGGATQGTSDFKKTSWGGPFPPPGSGTHRYFFKVYALSAELGLKARATKDELLAAMQGKIIAKGELYGTYQR